MLKSWQFECQCPRCAAVIDDTRGMSCSCGGVRMATKDGWASCESCGLDVNCQFKRKLGSVLTNMGVSKNRGTPKWMVYNGKPY